MATAEELLVEEVRAFLRSESATRKLWRRRAWLGRRTAFAVLEDVIFTHRWFTPDRNDTDARHAFARRILDALETIDALDIVGAARWAEGAFEDAIEATEPNWEGVQKSPVRTAKRRPR